jgi:hypothetical protein
MSVKENFVEKLQRQSRQRLLKLREQKQERQREQKNSPNILPLQSRSLERGRHFHLLFILLLLKDLFYCLSLKAFETIFLND